MIDMINILNKNIEEEIVNTIDEVKEELKGLDYERTCKIYSDYISDNLHNKNILHKKIDTNDLGCSYSHRFCIVPDKEEYYLVDLTFNQFKNAEFPNLLLKGYTNINEEELKRYLEIVGKDNKNIELNELFYGKSKTR